MQTWKPLRLYLDYLHLFCIFSAPYINDVFCFIILCRDDDDIDKILAQKSAKDNSKSRLSSEADTKKPVVSKKPSLPAKPKPAGPKPSLPAKPKPVGKPSLQKDTNDLDVDDIMKYIEENSRQSGLNTGNDMPDLFSWNLYPRKTREM